MTTVAASPRASTPTQAVMPPRLWRDPTVWGFVTFVALVAVAHVLWLDHFRRGLPLQIDEAGYLGFAFDDRRGFAGGGIGGFFDAAVAQRQFAPLVPMVAAPILAVFGDAPVVGMTVQLVFLAVLAGAAFLLGHALAGRNAGLITGCATVLSPIIIDFTRTFHFAIASAAFLCLAVCALVRSDRLSRWPWSITFGVAVGLMMLSRTFTIAFLPGLAVAAALALLRSPAPRGTSVRNLALATGAALATAAWWYVPNLSVVLKYLFGFGYGAEATTYAKADSPLTVRFWVVRLSDIVSQGLYLPTALVLLAALLIFTVGMVRRRGASRVRVGRVLDWAATPVGTVVVVTVVSYFALTSSTTGVTGGGAPMVPLVVALGVAAMVKLHDPVRAILVVALAATLTLTAVTKTTVTGELARPRCINLPAMRCVKITDGRGNSQAHLSFLGAPAVDPVKARDGAAGKWARLPNRVATWIGEARDRAGAGVPVVVFFASRDPLFNTNTVGLAWRTRYRDALPVGQLAADDGGDTESNYYRKMAAPEFGQPNFLITADRGPHEFPPAVNQRRVERAARRLGFERVRSFHLPDGRTARLYQRIGPLPSLPESQPTP